MQRSGDYRVRTAVSITQQRLPSLVTRCMQINIQYNVVLRHEVLIGVSKKNSVDRILLSVSFCSEHSRPSQNNILVPQKKGLLC
jgi:hypothetical protein